MAESDDEDDSPQDRGRTDAAAAWRRDLALAAAFLTRLPVAPVPPDADEARRALRAYPVVGAGVGLTAGAALAAALGLGLPPAAAAVVAVAAQIVLTGALHEDGLADVADGLGPADRARRLDVMRDSRTGTFGVLALVLGTGARIAAVAALAEAGAGLAAGALVAAGAASRSVFPVLLRRLPAARDDGLGRSVGRPDGGVATTALALGGAIAWLSGGVFAAPAALAAAAAATAGFALLARRAFGGQTGDVLGAAQQIAETTVLLALAATRGDG